MKRRGGVEVPPPLCRSTRDPPLPRLRHRPRRADAWDRDGERADPVL